MKLERFNSGWTVAPGIVDPFAVVFGGAPEGKPVTLPHDAMIEEDRDPACPSATQSGFYPAKTYTYTKTFFAPTTWEKERQILEFEGVMGKAAVYVNGQFAASHENGYSQFFVDLKPYLNYGAENSVKVVAANSELASRWYPGSGIYRDVNLHTGGASWIPPEGLRLKTEYIEEDYALVCAQVALKSSYAQAKQLRLSIRLYDEAGIAAESETMVTLRADHETSAHLRITIPAPKLWSPDSPKLYRCVAEILEGDVCVDTAEEEFGIRTLRLDARKGLRINGETVKLRGCCIHHDNGIIGAATLYGAEEFRVRQLKQSGFNAIRSAHHPMGKTMLRVCDRLGMMVMDELSDMWNVQKNCYDRSFAFSDHMEDEIARMVAKDYNHACVVFYSTGNEIPEIGAADGRALNRSIVERFHELDDTRYTTAGMNGLLAAAPGLGAYMAQMGVSRQQAKKDAEASKAIAKEPEAGGSENLNAAMAIMQRERLAAFAVSQLVTDSLEEASGTLDATGLNYLTARHELENQLHPDRVVIGSETYPSEIADLWEIVERNPHVIGDFTWTGYDYVGEAGIGIFHYESENQKQGWYPDRLAYCGDINLNGYRRPASFLREIAYGLRTEPYIAVDRPEHYGQRHDHNDWKYGDAVDSWTWPGFEGKTVRVRVLARAEEAELFLNGVSMGKKAIGEQEKLTVYFDLPYKPGELAAVCYTDGRETGRAVLSTAGKPVRLSVQTVNPVLPADDSGVAFLIVEPTDGNGQVNRAEKKTITVSVEGAGFLAGFGSADPSCEGSYQDTSWETYDGRVMAAIRSGNRPGLITVRFAAEGCPTETVQLEAKVTEQLV